VVSYPEFGASRRKGVFMRCICGVRKANLQRKRVIMLNLTTNSANTVGLTDDEMMQGIGKAWNDLHRLLTARFGDFEHYFLVTNEGNGVLHVVVIGLPFLYWKVLARWWNYLYGSFCWISRARGDSQGIAKYLMSQYLSSQDATKVYARMSNDWVCPRFMVYWRMLRHYSRDYRNGYRSEYSPLQWVYPVDKDLLIRNFVRWLRYYVWTGILRNYPVVPKDFVCRQTIQTSIVTVLSGMARA
jgi:hypothetical protein